MKKKIKITDEEKMKILHHLLSIYQPDEGKLPHGSLSKVANKFGIGPWTTKYIYGKAERTSISKKGDLIVDGRPKEQMNRFFLQLDKSLCPSGPL